ncbi:MAG: hypothetical protein ACLUR5_13200 [Eubacterium ventriosum]
MQHLILATLIQREQDYQPGPCIFMLLDKRQELHFTTGIPAWLRMTRILLAKILTMDIYWIWYNERQQTASHLRQEMAVL